MWLKTLEISENRWEKNSDDYKWYNYTNHDCLDMKNHNCKISDFNSGQTQYWHRGSKSPKFSKSIWNTAVAIKNCKQLFSLRLAFTTQKKATPTTEMMSVEFFAIFWVVNASSGEKSCLQFSIPTGSGAGGEGGVSHRLNNFLFR